MRLYPKQHKHYCGIDLYTVSPLMVRIFSYQ